MIRVILIDLFVFLLPFIIYFSYIYLVNPARAQGDMVQTAPLYTLFAIGVLLVLGAIAYFIQFSSGRPGQHYVPPSVENGVIRPGHME